MSVVITWAHRNRIAQADQLIGWTEASIGPEPGVHYALQVLTATDVLLVQKLDIDGTTATVASDHVGALKFRLWSIRDEVASREVVEWVRTLSPPDAGLGTTITAATWFPPATPPQQPSGEPLVASGIAPPVLLISSDGTDYVYSS